MLEEYGDSNFEFRIYSTHVIAKLAKYEVQGTYLPYVSDIVAALSVARKEKTREKKGE